MMIIALMLYAASAALVRGAPFSKRNGNSLMMPLTHVDDSFYTTNLEFGNPLQSVDLVVDSGSADTWVMSSSNPFCSSNSNTRSNQTYDGSRITSTIDCQGLSTFNVNASSSFRNLDIGRFYINYTDGSLADGYWATDKVLADSVDVSGMQFGVAEYASAEISGILGIGFPRRESVRGYTGAPNKFYDNFPQVLKDKGIISTVAYSMYLNDPNGNSGSLLFGAVDPSKYSGKLYTFPMVNTYPNIVKVPATLAMTLQGIGARNKNQQQTFTNTKSAVLLDSGTSLMAAPQEIVAKMAHFISENATYSESDGVYTMECPADDDDTEFVFEFGDLFISVPLSTLILTPSSGSLCGLGVLPTEDESWTLGDVFMSYAYLVFDLDNYQISMAVAKFSKDGNQEASVQIQSDGTIPGAIKASAEPWTTNEPLTVSGSIFGNKKANSTSVSSSSFTSSTRVRSDTARETGVMKATSFKKSQISPALSHTANSASILSTKSTDRPISSVTSVAKSSSDTGKSVYTSIFTKYIYAATLTTTVACNIS